MNIENNPFKTDDLVFLKESALKFKSCNALMEKILKVRDIERYWVHWSKSFLKITDGTYGLHYIHFRYATPVEIAQYRINNAT